MHYGIRIGFILTVIILVACQSNNPNEVARVNNHPITKSELQHRMLLEKANVYSYFYRKYGVDDCDDFWFQKLGDEVPIEKLRKVALTKVVRMKTQQILAFEKGLIKTINFDDILKDLEIVNAQRKQKVEQGEPIYGPVRFTSRTYFQHEFDRMVIKLKDELAKDELKPDQDELIKLQKANGQPDVNLSGFFIKQYVDKNYQRYIDLLSDSCDVEINNEEYEKIIFAK